MDQGEGLPDRKPVSALMVRIHFAHCHGEHFRAPVVMPPVRVRRGVHPDLQGFPRHAFPAQEPPLQFRKAPWRQNVSIHNADKTGRRHAQQRHMVIPQAFNHLFREGQHP